MLDLSDPEREHLTEMRALSSDSEGHEVFVGLAHEATVRFEQFRRDFLTVAPAT